MKKRSLSALLSFTGALLLFSGSDLFAALSQDFINQNNVAIDSLRKRNCTVKFSLNGASIAGKEVRILQTHNDFGFGGVIHSVGFNSDSATYADVFCKYFDWAVPENEMKWPYTEKAPDSVDYKDADYLVDWCNKHGIKVRGHCLFWNEDTIWLPRWTYTLNAAQFKAAMQKRITNAMTHFRGKVAHWDIVNELTHYPQATHATPEKTLLDSMSGDPKIFSWILNEARKIDSVAKFTINDYAVVEGNDYPIFINKVNRLITDKAPLDIVGLEGHFGDSLTRSFYLEHLNLVTAGIARPIWLTEVDWTVPYEDLVVKTEEFMRTCFAHPNVGGIMLWAWWEAKKWRSELTSVLADGILGETEMGTVWRTLRESWKTNITGTTDADGQIKFRGFQGEYAVRYTAGDKTYAGTFYLEPGKTEKTVAVTLKDTVLAANETKPSGVRTTLALLNGRLIRINNQVTPGERLFLSTYSITGRLLAKTPFSLAQKTITIPKSTAGCRLVKIGTDTRSLYTGRLLDIR